MKSYSVLMRTSIISLLMATSFLAVYVATAFFFPYIVGKNIGFRTLVELALLLYIPLAVVAPQYRPHKSTGLLVYGFFIVVILVADILGVNPGNSLFSNFERMEGFVTHIHLFVFTCMLVFLRLTQKEWHQIFWVYLIGNALVLVQSFGEILTISNKLASGQEAGTRIASTLGNPAYLAIYTIFGIFFAGLLLIQRKDTARIIEKALYIASIVANLVVLWRSETRGTVLGLVAGSGVALMWYVFKNRDNKKLRNATLGALLAGVVVIVLFISSRQSDFIQNNPTLKRLAAITLTEQTVRSRFMIWEMSLQGVKERPLLGWGQDNFGYVFAKHYDPEMFDQEQWFDRSHNVFFDWLIAGGVVGLLAYLALFVSSVYTALRKKTGLSSAEQALILGALVTYFVHNVFVFDNLISYIGFFTLYAYLVSRGMPKSVSETRKVPRISKAVFWSVVGTSCVSIYAAWYITLFIPMQLNTAIINMYRSTQGVANRATSEKVSDAMLAPALFGSPEAKEQYLTFVSALAQSKLPEEDKKYFFNQAATVFRAEIEKDPLNPRPAALFGGFLSAFGLYKESALFYQKALAATPTKTLLWLELAKSYYGAGDKPLAVLAAEKSFGLSARSLQSAKVLTLLYYETSQNDKINDVWDKALVANKESLPAYVEAATFYKEVKDTQNMQRILDQMVKKYPNLQQEAAEFGVMKADKMP